MNTTSDLPDSGTGSAVPAGLLTINDDWQPVKPASNRIAKLHRIKRIYIPLFGLHENQDLIVLHCMECRRRAPDDPSLRHAMKTSDSFPSIATMAALSSPSG
ncbi:hypothetical protein [Rhodanobacter sp. C01]|uniref:hypothetical protein n=1 Tax=Rhodanobacter sp. C01 TaxID=1945856 RepID=UPI0011154F83|nr:hypothetical protein [Rhodanobacter sp. C01]